MIAYFCQRLEAGKPAAGLFLAPQDPSAVGAIIESLLFVWGASEADKWRDRIVYLPL
jgi:hypothetical protein